MIIEIVLALWGGLFPVAQETVIPSGMRSSNEVGYIGDQKTYDEVLKHFQPDSGEKLKVDFNKEIVVFARNTSRFNKISKMTIRIEDGVGRVSLVTTRSNVKVKDKIYLVMGVVSREGLKELTYGLERMKVR